MITQRIITYSFYLLFFLTPLIFSPLTSELFEFNKMFFVYFLTVIITGTWVIQSIINRQFVLKRTPLDIPLIIFLISQILSTIYSMDPHTSLWGYYSRSNGGLFSIISYLLLFYALVSNFEIAQGLKFLKAALLGGLVVALYAIPEHFGLSPSCLILTRTLTADCWVQDVQARVFATLGQPNWLAAYLAMLIFPAIYFALTAKTKQLTINYLLLTIIYYLAFTFTYSRGAALGLLAGMVVFLSFWGAQRLQNLNLSLRGAKRRSNLFKLDFSLTRREALLITRNDKIVLTILGIFLLINLLFGSALTRFQLSSFFSQSQTTNSQLPTTNSVGTQLENGGTESGQIRLIVWKGAVEIFKHYPLLGSGVETFGYSYYNFRPVEHNLVSEWDFLYNKAHNEYLNYLATTGVLGFGSYILMIGTFLVYGIKYIVFSKKQKSPSTTYSLLHTTILASYVSYLVQNFVQFSVVIIALFFYTFPAFAFLAAGDLKRFEYKLKFNQFFYYFSLGLVILTITVILFVLVQFWRADTFYKRGQDASDTNLGKAFNLFTQAVELNSSEPLYHVELGSAVAYSAIQLVEEDATLSAYLKDQSISETKKALEISPKNTSLWRTAILTYYTLSLIDPDYEQVTLDSFDQTIKLAPTDPKLYYNKALILDQLNKPEQAITTLNQVTALKPNYDEALFLLAEEYQKTNQLEEAKDTYQKILIVFPNEPRALQKLQELATASAKPK